MMLAAGSCDPSVEACKVATSLERPSGDAFYGIMRSYFPQIVAWWVSVIASTLPLLIYDNDDSDDDIDSGVLATYTFSSVLKFLVFLLPFNLQATYGIFGSDFFLFSWVDEVLANWIMPRFIPNMTFWLVVLDLYLFSRFTSESFMFHLWMFIFQIAQDLYWWDATMKSGRDSIRFLDPSWNEIASGDRLWPTFFYTLGLVEKSNAVNYEDSSSSAVDSGK